MKTLTEFSPLVLRKAAEARANAPRPAAPPPAPNGEAAAAPGGEASATPEGEAPAGEVPAGEPAAEAAEASAEAAPAPAADPAIDAVAAALSVQPDRAARLLEALDIVGDRLDEVRLVRVFQGEAGPQHAVSRGEFHYVIDRVAGPPKRSRDRDDRRGGRGERGGGGGGGGGGRGGFGGRGDRDKPRGLGSLKAGAAKDDKDARDDRPGRGEMPRAGIGWQLTAAPRSFDRPGGGPGRGRGGPKRGRGGPGGPDDRRGPRRDRDDRGPRGPRGPRPEGAPHHEARAEGSAGRPQGGPPPGPRLGPDGQPVPPRSKRPRKPIGPDANGLGPDGTPWDPERAAKRKAERDAKRTTDQAPMNTAPVTPVEAQTPPAESPSKPE